MHPQISEWPSLEFYNAALRNGARPPAPLLPHRRIGLTEGVRFVDISGTEIVVPGSSSRQNDREALWIADHLAHLLPVYSLNNLTVGVICAYAAQKDLVRRRCLERTQGQRLDFCVFDTVDAFQGGEKDVIYVSFVRSTPGSIGFLDNPNRLNVAATRAKRACIFVGKLDVLAAGSSTFSSLRRSLEARDLVAKIRSVV